MSGILWQPDSASIATSEIERFAHRYAGCSATDYNQLHQWSIDNSGVFWSHLWDYCAIKGFKGTGPWVHYQRHIQDAQWFPAARLNYAENLLHPDIESAAIVFYSETGERRCINHRQLYLQVARVARFLRDQGIQPGDRVAACLPNTIETIVAFLATASIGAIWASCSPDFGTRGIVDRFSQIKPKVFFFVESYSWKGKEISVIDKIRDVINQIPTMELRIQVPFLDVSNDSTSHLHAHHWNDIQETDNTSLVFEQVPFNHPLYILFSSGTTGVPKCIVHRAGGMLLQHLKEHRLHNDISAKDRVFFYTTCGWMMWNWLVTALAAKCCIMLYDGSPLYPHSSVLFDYARTEKLSFFGVSASYITRLEKLGVSIDHPLEHLKTIGSTGSVLAAENFDYVYQHLAPDCRLSSMSGGTDIASCFVLGNPVLPVKRGEIQSAGLGLQVAVVNEQGHNIINHKGELVCRNAFPAMPLNFWNDEDGSRYYKTYFARFDNIWTHGDFALQTEEGGFIIFGRSDATLNPGGIRIGTAEIYRQVAKIEQVLDSVVVGQRWQDDIRIVLFVVLREGVELHDQLKQQIQRTILVNTSPRHVPDIILTVPDIPRTRNGKVSEIAVRDIINGDKIHNIESLQNPQSLDYYASIKALQEVSS